MIGIPHQFLMGLKQPWFIFLVVALVAQQANLLTCRFGANNAIPAVFIMYSFATQAVTSFLLMLFFKGRGFPITPFKRKMWYLLFFLVVCYTLNEVTLLHVYALGAPYSLMMVVFAVSTLVVMVSFAFAVLKEKIDRRKIAGIILAVISIILIRLG